jgi:hypothetical protein
VAAGNIESSNGRPSATPAPRSSVRREMCFFVMNIALYSTFVAVFTFIVKAGLWITPISNDENR